MNKFKKILLGTILGLAVTTPAVGMVGCSKLGPDPDLPVEQPEEQQQTQSLTVEKVSNDLKAEIKKFYDKIVENNTPFAEYHAFADRLNEIDNEIFALQTELNEIAECLSLLPESVHPDSYDYEWVANNEEDQDRVDELFEELSALKEERTEVEDEIDAFLDEANDFDPYGDLELPSYAISDITDLLDNSLYQLSIYKDFKLNKFYLSEGGDILGCFKTDENTLVLLDQNCLYQYEYDGGKLSKITQIDGTIVSTINFKNEAYLYADIADNYVPEDPEEEYYSPYINFNNGKLSFDDIQNILDYDGETGEAFYPAYLVTVKFGEGKLSVRSFNAYSPADYTFADIALALKVFSDCGVKLPMRDVVDEYYSKIPQNIFANLEGVFSWDDFDWDEFDDEIPELGKLYEFVDRLFDYIDAGVESYNDLQIIKVAKYVRSEEVVVEPKSLEEVEAESLQCATFQQVGYQNIIVTQCGYLDVFEELSDVVRFEFIDDYFNDAFDEYNGVIDYTYDEGPISAEELMFFDSETYFVRPTGPYVQIGNFSAVLGIIVDEDGNQEFMGLIPFNVAIQE